MSINTFSAYGVEHRAIETVMRMHSVKRWHMIDTTRQQTLAEHSANVALLAFLIAKTAPINFFDDSSMIALAGLTHDTAEAFTGDIPSHTKRHLTGIEELEHTVSAIEFDTEQTSATYGLVKLCDLADGIRFIRLHGVDLTANHAQRGLEDQLSKKLIELQWPDHIRAHVVDYIVFYAYEK
jgi:hypothetical protein